MKKIIVSLVILFTTGTTMLAQQVDNDSSNPGASSIDDVYSRKVIYNPKDIDGSTHIFKNWQNTAKVYTLTKLINTYNINYNAKTDDFSSLMDDNSEFIFNSKFLDSIEVNSKKFKKYKDEFYEVLYEGDKISLLKKYDVKVIPGVFNPIDATRTKDSYNVIDNFFIYQNNELTELDGKKKSILKVTSAHESEIKEYAKKEKLSYKKEEDLINIFNYYNQLLIN